MRIALGFGLIILLGSCGDPASEAPVALKPGMYDISALGESYVEISPSNIRDKKCLTAFDVSEFERFPMLHGTRRLPECTERVEPRTGNLVLGRQRCTSGHLDQDETVSNYEVVISEERFVIKGQVKDRRDGTGPKTGTFTVIGSRIGDC
jgi:hypothetical protein